jgi:hypothetical protein
MSLVGSSNPGDVDRDAAVRLLAERAVLTRAICRELLEVVRGLGDRRPHVAMGLLLQWVTENLPESVRVEPHPSDGLDRMVVPDGLQDLFEEIRHGAEVGEALFMLWTADSQLEAQGDEARIRERLAAYWDKHPSAVRAPLAIESWSGFRRPEGGTVNPGGSSPSS